MTIKNSQGQKGQALITLIIFILIAISVTSAGVAATLSSIFSASETEQGIIALSAAESSIENAILRYIRNPSYTGDTLVIGGATVTTQIVGNPPTFTAVGRYQNSSHTVQVQTVYNNNALTISSWKEIN